MKKAVTILLFALFLITLTGLARYIFLHQTGIPAMSAVKNDASLAGMYRKTADIDLGKVEVYNYQRMGFTHGFLQFSPNSRYLALGTEQGDILFMNVDGKTLWKRSIGLGKISALTFSPDGSKLLVGDTSQQGSLICFDTATGNELWRYASASELEPDIRQKIYPGIVYITTDEQGFIYAVGQRYKKNSDGSNEYRDRIYKLDENNGNKVAMFPPDHDMDAWVSWVGVDRQGRRLVFGTGNWDTGKTCRYDDNVYCLDDKLNQPLWSVFIDPVTPYQRTTMRSSPDISADGSYIAGIANDGRCFLYDGGGRELWRRTLSQPRQIGGVYINATGMFVRIVGGYVVLTTGNTYNRANWQLPTPVDHPARNTIFVFDLQGNLMYKHSTGGMVEEMSINDGRIVLAVGRNVRTKDPSVHGIQILSLEDGRLLDSMPTAGPCIGEASSADGRYVAGIEAPIQLDDGQIIGSYRLYIWEKK
ncbi:MAG: PQQ-binding-like beta-propeller repeat protein [Veillonellales bacterium]